MKTGRFAYFNGLFVFFHAFDIATGKCRVTTITGQEMNIQWDELENPKFYNLPNKGSK